MAESASLSSNHTVDTRHLTASELAGYVDHALDDDARRVAEEHLDECQRCRDEAMAIMNVAESYAANAHVLETDAPSVRPSPRHRPAFRRVAIGLAAVAAGLVVAVVARRPDGLDEQIAAVRAPKLPAGASETAMTAAAPADGATIPARAATFSWHPTTTDTYQFTLLTGSGGQVWSQETPDTSLTLPAAITLEPGRTYFWRVDAMRDGIAATSGPRRLLVAP